MGVDVSRTDLSAIVLAGGASRRFGSDKTRADLAGQSVLAHVLQAVASATPDVLVVGSWAPEGWRRASEPTPGRGPLGALAHGIAEVGTRWVVVVGGDHPLLRPALVELLVERAVSGQALAVVPVHEGRDQPLVACYRRDVVAAATELIDRGERRLGALLDAVDVDRVVERSWRRSDADGRSFLDVDTPGDLERARQLLDG